MKRPRALLLGLALLAAAAAVRLPSLPAGLPYLNYVDEGHVLHHVIHLLERRTWEPEFYIYPSFPFYLIALPAAAWSPAYEAIHGRPLRADLSPAPPRYYDLVYPAELIVLGRLVTLAFSLGLVVLTGLYAQRLAGPAAGWFAAWLAALLPAFAIRSVSVNVNPMAAFFSLAALYFAEDAREGKRSWRAAALAGAMVGLAMVSKYPSVVVCLPVALAILFARRPWRERAGLLVVAGAASAVAAAIAMPALVLRTGEVLAQVRHQSEVYKHDVIGSYWDQAVLWAEWDIPYGQPELGMTFLILTAAGLVVGLRDRSWRGPVLGWIAFAAATAVLFAPYGFRAFRNLLPLIPPGCLLVTLAYARLREALPAEPRRAVDLAAAALPVVFFLPDLVQFGRHQLAVVDTRERAIEWLADHARPQDRVLVAEELNVLPPRLASLQARTAILPWRQAQDRIFNGRFQYLVLAALVDRGNQTLISPPLVERILQRYAMEAQFGSSPTLDAANVFRGNDQVIYILRRKPGATEPQPITTTGRPPPPLPARGSARRSSAPSPARGSSAAPRGAPP